MNHDEPLTFHDRGEIILSCNSVENDDFSNSGETERQENVCSIDKCSKCNIYKGIN